MTLPTNDTDYFYEFIGQDEDDMYGAFFVHNDSDEKKVKYISFAKTHNTNGGFGL